MIKNFLFLLTILLSTTLLCNAQKVIPAPDMYIFGVAYSPVDSTVYITELQFIEGAHVNKKTGFLYSRNEYSSQLSDYMISLGNRHMTVSVTYDVNSKKAEKKYLSMKSKYQKSKYLIKYLASSEFFFSPVPYEETPETVTEISTEKIAKKMKKKASKKK